MATEAERRQEHAQARPTRRQELFMFIVLAVLIWPVIAVAVVGGFGFSVWMYQLLTGPPGPPG